MTIIGKLDAYWETGTEGVIWSVYENDKKGYDGLHCLENGDYLIVYDPVNTENIVWEGNIDLEYERNYRKFPMNPKYGQQAIAGMWVHGIQRDVEPDDWGNWFFKEYPAELVKSGLGPVYPCKSSIIAGFRWTGTASQWNNENGVGDLIVKFNNSDYYMYKDVDSSIFWAFEDAPSKGKYFVANIRDKFVTEKLELPKSPKK